LAVRRPALHADPGEQRRVEPAAVLVGALEVEIDVLVLGVARRHRQPRHAGLEPHVDDVLLALELARAGAALLAHRARRHQLADAWWTRPRARRSARRGPS